LTKLNRHKEILAFYEKCPHPLIIDVGANINVSAVWFGKNFPKANIVA
jgi:hypothetical protein